MFPVRRGGIRKLFGSVQVPVKVMIPVQHITVELSREDARSRERINEAAREQVMELLQDSYERGREVMTVLVDQDRKR